MKSFSLAIALFLVFSEKTMAQFASVGMPVNADFELKECSFDPEAKAVVLLHEAVSNYDDRYQLVTTHHYRIKVLKENGLDAADISIPFFVESDFENIRDISGFTINKSENGSIERIPIESKSIYREKTNPYVNHVKIAFPKVQVNSIIDYQYTSVMKHYGGLENWDFQESLPTIKSAYDLYIIPNAEFSYVVKGDPNKVKVNSEPGRVQFSMENIPGLPDEPYMDARRDYLQRVEFQLYSTGDYYNRRKHMTSWKEVIRNLETEPMFGVQLNKSLEGSGDFLKMIKDMDPLTRMNQVLGFVKRQMAWNGMDGKYSRGVKDAWNKKAGSSADINLALINILRDADLNADPLLVSERSHGMVYPNVPFVDQFNKVVAHVDIDGKQYILDASDRFLPSSLFPPEILNTNALLMKRKDGGLINIKDEKGLYRWNVSVQMSLEGDSLHAQSSCTAIDYARMEELRKYLSAPKVYVDRKYRDALPNGSLKSFESINEQTDSVPYRHSVKFSSALQKSGDYVLLNTNFFNGLDQNPFVSKSRNSNINFGYRKLISSTVHIKFPEGMSVDALPKSVMLSTPDKSISFTREYLTDPNNPVILMRMKLETKASWYGMEDYPQIQEFYKKMFEMLNEQVILKKS